MHDEADTLRRLEDITRLPEYYLTRTERSKTERRRRANLPLALLNHEPAHILQQPFAEVAGAAVEIARGAAIAAVRAFLR